MKVIFDDKKDVAIKLANSLINTNDLHKTITLYGCQSFDDIASQIEFWNQHISNCLLDDNKNISLNDNFKNNTKFYYFLLEEIGNKLKDQSYLFKEEIKAILGK